MALRTALWLLLGGALSVASASSDPESDAAADPLWRRLLHLDADGHSRIDSPEAFLSSAGAGAGLALAELRAGLAALAAGEARYSCRFPARADFLRARFPARAQTWPRPDCPQYRAWRASLPDDRVTLVFASAYMNNPSSMFGHTLLRLDRDDAAPLLSRAVNFAARTRDSQGIAYAVKGLTGGYPGQYGIYPYYDKVRDYARIENRDLWEYALALEPAAINRLLAHLWELRELHFDYFFLDENCSYQLLALLEVARPDLNLTGPFRYWASPVETIRHLRAQPGLVAAVTHRPALQTQLLQGLASLDEGQALALGQVLAGGDWPVQRSPEEQARLAELVHDWAWYQQQNRAWISGRLPAARRAGLPVLAEDALIRRSRLPDPPTLDTGPSPTEPDQGHPGERLSLGLDWQDGAGGALLLGWRPVQHDLLDPPRAYAAGAAIEVLSLAVSAGQDRARLHSASAIRIDSRAPRDRWFQPWSWRVEAGFERPQWSVPGHGQLGGGIGVSWGRGLAFDALVLGELLLGPRLSRDRGAALGLELGLRAGAGAWSLHWQARHQALLAFAGSEAGEAALQAGLSRVVLGQQWQIGPRLGLRLEARRMFRPATSGISLSLLWYG